MNYLQRQYLMDILTRISFIEADIQDGLEAFLHSRHLQDSIVLSFMLIGENVKRINKTLLAIVPDLNWGEYAETRDFFIHQYDKLSIQLVWQYANEDIAPLKVAIYTFCNIWIQQNQTKKPQTEGFFVIVKSLTPAAS